MSTAPSALALSWSRNRAHLGESVALRVPVPGFAPRTLVRLRIYPTSGDPATPLAKLKCAVDDSGVAQANWTVACDTRLLDEPRLVFDVTIGDDLAVGPVLTILDRLRVSLIGPDTRPLANVSLSALDCYGQPVEASTDANGRAELSVPAGTCQLLVDGYLLAGEQRPGQRNLVTGRRHKLHAMPLPHRVAIASPKHGCIHIAGSRLPVATHTEPPAPANALTLHVGGAARLVRAANNTYVELGPQPGQVEVLAEVAGARARASLATILPSVESLELRAAPADTALLFDHTLNRQAACTYRFAAGGRLSTSHPGAFVMGATLTADLKLRLQTKPAEPVEIDLALVSRQNRSDRGLPKQQGHDAQNGPLVLRALATNNPWLLGSETDLTVNLVANRPLPACVQRLELRFDVRMNVRQGDRWYAAPDDVSSWLPLGELDAIEVFSLWQVPLAALGTEARSQGAPLKRNEIDPFHVRHATRWAQGGFHLRPGVAGSIVGLVLERLSHYRYPDDMEGKEGLAASHHRPPHNQAQLPASGIGAQVATDSRGATIEEPVSEVLVVDAHREGELSICIAGASPLALAIELPDGQRAPKHFAVRIDDNPNQTMVAASKRGHLRFAELDAVKAGRHKLSLVPRSGNSRLDAAPWRARIGIRFSKLETQSWDAATSWGWEVLDHPTHPGGNQLQRASAACAVLRTLGVDARVLFARAQPGGGVRIEGADPLTFGASNFDAKTDWGPNLCGFVALGTENPHCQRLDGDLVAETPVVIDVDRRSQWPGHVARETAYAAASTKRKNTTITHCHQGHEWTPTHFTDWQARIRSGAPFSLELTQNPADGDARWGRIDGFGHYTMWFQPPNRLWARGPQRLGAQEPVGEGRRANSLECFAHETWVPARMAINHWGHLWQFDNAGCVRDPQNPELGVVGKLHGLGCDPFTGDFTTRYASYPVALAAPFAREDQQERSFRLGTFDQSLPKEGTLGVLVAISEPYAGYQVHTRVFVDNDFVANVTVACGQATPWVALPENLRGGKRLRIQAIAIGRGPMEAGLRGVVTIQRKSAPWRPKRCVTCNAQPRWPAVADGTHLLADALHPCPSCNATVHSDENSCWACGVKLSRHAVLPRSLRSGGPRS